MVVHFRHRVDKLIEAVGRENVTCRLTQRSRFSQPRLVFFAVVFRGVGNGIEGRATVRFCSALASDPGDIEGRRNHTEDLMYEMADNLGIEVLPG